MIQSVPECNNTVVESMEKVVLIDFLKKVLVDYKVVVLKLV